MFVLSRVKSTRRTATVKTQQVLDPQKRAAFQHAKRTPAKKPSWTFYVPIPVWEMHQE
jgi:hypothetical protein